MPDNTVQVTAVTVDIQNADGTSATAVPAVALTAPFLADPVYLYPPQALKLAAGLINAALPPAPAAPEVVPQPADGDHKN